MSLKTECLSFSYNENLVIDDINLELLPGEIVALIGPNGCGKTTLLKNISQVLKPQKGTVYLNFLDLSRLTTKELARYMAVLEQEISTSFNFTVQEIVSLGRIAYSKLSEKNENERIVFEAMKKVDVIRYAAKSILSLSSGERQRVWFAMALAQKPQILILDEPISYLDIKYQAEILKIIKTLSKDHLSILISMHDLNLAVQYANKVIMLKSGKIFLQGKPKDVFTKESLKTVFDINAEIIKLSEEDFFIRTVK